MKTRGGRCVVWGCPDIRLEGSQFCYRHELRELQITWAGSGRPEITRKEER